MLYLDKVTEGEVRRDAATDAGIYRPMIHEKADMAVVSAAYPGTPWNQECVRMRMCVHVVTSISWNVGPINLHVPFIVGLELLHEIIKFLS